MLSLKLNFKANLKCGLYFEPLLFFFFLREERKYRDRESFTHVFLFFHLDRQHFETMLFSKREYPKEYLLGTSGKEGEMTELMVWVSVLQ